MISNMCIFVVNVKPFQIKSELNEHEKIHANEKPFKYDQCEIGFDSKTTMNRHKANFHDSKTQNQTSVFEYKRKNDLDPQKSHLRIENSNIKKKDGSELKRKSGMKSDCQETIASDTTEVVVKKKITEDVDSSSKITSKNKNQKGHYKCPICAKVYVYRHKLSSHLKNKHDFKKVLFCLEKGCEKIFECVSKFGNHLKKEHQWKSQCEICGKVLKGPQNKWAHKKNAHNAAHSQITEKSSNFDPNLKVTSAFSLSDCAQKEHENRNSKNAENADFEQSTKKVKIENQNDNKNASNTEDINVDQFAFEQTLKKIKPEDQGDEITKLNQIIKDLKQENLKLSLQNAELYKENAILK